MDENGEKLPSNIKPINEIDTIITKIQAKPYKNLISTEKNNDKSHPILELPQNEILSQIYPSHSELDSLKLNEKISTPLLEFNQIIQFGKINYKIPDEINGEIDQYQQEVLTYVTEDPSIPDYEAAYTKLISERNKPWKLNPSDIADFYLLESFIRRNSGTGIYNEDTRNMALMKARERISEIGKRLLIAISFEQLDEYDRWTALNPGKISAELSEKIRKHPVNQARVNIDEKVKGGIIEIEEVNAYLAEFKSQLEGLFVSESGNKSKIDQELFTTSLQILENQQTGRWQTMATLLRGLGEKDLPIEQVLKRLGMDEIDPNLISEVEKSRELFLIDRLINFVHNTGRMSARVTNYFPRAATLLMAHGMRGHDDYLYFYSSIMNSTDNLAKFIENDLKQSEKRDVIEDLVKLIESGSVPREYQYALLLEIADPRIKEAISRNSHEKLSPSHIYTLLQNISHHDGTSRGRLKKAA